MDAAAAARVGVGSRRSPAAAATADVHSSPLTARRAWWRATSADEHAVSMLTHGPCSPRQYERRPLATDVVSPVAA